MKRSFFILLLLIVLQVNSYGFDLVEVLNEELQWLVIECTDYYNIPTDYLVRQMFLESSFISDANRKETNGSTSVGLLQLNSRYFDYFEERFYTWGPIDGSFDPYNIYHNVQVACAYIAHLYEQFKGDWMSVFMAYNAGPTRVIQGNVPNMTHDYASFVVTGSTDMGYYGKRLLEFDRLVVDKLK